MKTKLQKIFFLIALFLASPHFARAGVIFETNFDSDPNWNMDGSKDNIYDGCSPVSISNSTNTCGTDYPTNWDGWRSVANNVTNAGTYNYSATMPILRIGALPSSQTDHTGGGKAMIVTNMSYNHPPGLTGPSDPGYGVPWPGDGLLIKKFTSTYPELYVQLWVRTQPGWHWNTNTSNSGGTSWGEFKFFRTTYWNPAASGSQANIFIQSPDQAPIMFTDMAHDSGSNQDGLAPAYRCSNTTTTNRTSDFYCGNIATGSNAYQANDYTYSDSYTISDGGWHRMKYHMKLNTAGSNNGVYEVWKDGHKIQDHQDVIWKETGSNIPGFNTVWFGGNSSNSWAPTGGSQWYAIDDIVVSDADIADGYVPGGVSDTTAPTITAFTAPSSSASLNIDLSSQAFTGSDNVGVASYLITTSSTQPTSSTSGWTSSRPTTFAATQSGNLTLYPWVMDGAGNVSSQADAINFAKTVNITAASAIVGHSSTAGTPDSADQNVMDATQITTPVGSNINVSSISVYVPGPVDPSTSHNSAQVAIYSDSAGSPHSLVASSVSVTLTVGWNIIPISATLTSSTSYWLAYNTNASTNNYNNLVLDTGGLMAYQSSVTYGTWPGTFTPSEAPFAGQMDIYLTYNLPSSDSVAPAAPSGLSVL